MPSPEEQAYSAVERAYGQGDFARALELAEALQPQLQPERDDLLDQRLQLLIGHIHLYGLGQPDQAAQAYRTVLAGCREPNYRQLAEQSLQLCTPAVAESEIAEDSEAELPATPWLQQLQDPQQALTDIQQAWATVVPAALPEPVPAAEAGAAATPWAEEGAEPSAPNPPEAVGTDSEPEQPEQPQPPLSDTQPEPEPMPDPELEQGLLLVRLSSRADQPELLPTPALEPPDEPGGTIHVAAPSLGAAWTLFKRHWRAYLILEGLVVAAAAVGALLQLIGAGLQGLAETNLLLAVLPGLALAVAAIALNLWSNLLGVSLQMLPALAFQRGEHPSAAAMLQLLRRDFWRYVRAGVVVGLATTIGLLLLIVPGVLVAIATPVVIRRVVCQQEAAVPALIASVQEVGSSPAGAGLLKWQLVAGLLILGSVLLCGLPLLITVPLGAILIQQYLAYSGLGSARE